MPPLEELTGRTLGDFVVRHKIGEGGFGAVYRAEQPLLGREAVIKVLHNRHRSSKTVLQRFLREARLASKLDHPYAAHIYAFGAESDNLMWIAMEYVKGQSLHELLRSKGPMPLEEFVPLLDRICEVLQAAHDLGIVHRDIKPPNVMVVQRSGRAFPKLLDFGIAKLAEEPRVAVSSPEIAIPPPSPSGGALAPHDRDGSPTENTVSFIGQPGGALAAGGFARVKRHQTAGLAETQQADTPSSLSSLSDEHEPALTEAGAAVGSPPYMAPEQWDDSAAATARTDLYALGIMTYEALTGRRPFVGNTLAVLAIAHASAPVPPLGGTLPVALDDVIAKVLAKSPADRFPTAMAFAQAIRTAAGFGSQPLPNLDDDLRASVEASFPQPLAEAVAAFHAARNAHQGRDALRDIASTAIRYVALVALASQAQVHRTDSNAATSIAERFRDLRRRALIDEEWLLLARELTAPFTSQPQTHPMPELVALLHPATDHDVLAAVAQVQLQEPDALVSVRARLPEITRLLRALTFLADYPLVVATDGRAEAWMGVRRPRRVALEIHGRSVEPGKPMIVDAGGRPVVALWPLVQTSMPMPGAPLELFLLDGRGRSGVRLVAMPQALERQDEHVLEWIAERFPDRERDTPVSDSQDTRPYRGLEPFTSRDAEVFVGREHEVDAAINRLRTSALVAVVGPSGSGKSSFVHAGILPSLPEGWATISVRPGATPIAALELRLRRAGLASTDLAAALARDHGALGELFQSRAKPTVLVIDQFEELFTLGASVDERRLYVRALLAAAQSPDDKLRVVLTLRDDFLSRATQLPELRDRLPTALFLLGTPGRLDLVRILTKPLARQGFDFDDPTLPDRMIDDVAETPGALALLSFTASKLWELRDRHFRQLTRKAYVALGGVAGALAQHANTTIDELPPSEQRLARTALRHLVTAEGTRAVLSRVELDQLLRDPAASTVIEKLVAARLLTATEAEAGDDGIEIIHEALVVAWPRLADWRREDAEGARLRDQVRAAARQWIDRGKPSGLLWRDDALAELEVWRARHPQPLTDADQAFVTASLADAKRGRRLRRGVIIAVLAFMAAAVAVLIFANQRTAAQQRIAEQERMLAQQLRDTAEQNLTKQYFETGRQLFVSGDAPRALAYLDEAFQRGVDTPAMRYLLAGASAPLRGERLVLRGHTDKVQKVRWSADGRRLLSASADHTARLWDAASGRLLAALDTQASVFDARFDPSSQRAVTASQDGRVRIYDREGALVRTLETDGSLSAWASFSPDGTLIAATTYNGGAYLWDAATGTPIATIADPFASAGAFSPDGARLVVAGSELAMFDTHTGKRVATMTGHASLVSYAAYSHDGKYVVSTSVDQTARLWDGKTGALLATMRGDGSVTLADFAPDDRTVTVISDGSAAKVWSVPGGEIKATLDGHATGAATALYDPTGRLIATGGADARAVIWDAASGAPLATLQGHGGTVIALAFSPDGRSIATGSYDGTIRIWDPKVTPLTGILEHGSEIASAQLSPDDTLVATATNDQVVWLWKSTGELVRKLEGHAKTPEVKADDPIVRFRGDGKLLVSGGDDGQLIAWDPATGAEVARAQGTSPIVDLQFTTHGDVGFGELSGKVGLWTVGTSPRWLPGTGKKEIRRIAVSKDGALLAAGGFDQVVRIWRTADATLVGKLDVGARIWDVAFSPDARDLVVGHDGAASLIELGTMHVLHRFAHNGYVEGARFRPDGAQIVTASEDGTAALWNVATGAREAVLSGHGRVVFAADYDPSGRFVLTGGSDRLARLWDSQTGVLLQLLQGHSIGVFNIQLHAGRYLSADTTRVCVWRLDVETATRAEMEAFDRCHVPWAIVEGQLVPRELDCRARSALPTMPN